MAVAIGGMGDVWLARHVALDRPVAVKVLHSDVAQGNERSLLEARTLAKLRHPAVVEVFDCGLDEAGAPYIVMELLIGKTLAASLAQSGPLGAVRAVQLLLPVLSGLAAVHAAGAIHRDLKPENIMLVPTDTGSPLGVSPKIIDFGIARDGQQAPSRLTETGTFVGTPQYMAPEQLLGSAGDVRSDLWSISAVLYESMSGAPPFVANELESLLRAIAYEPPAFPSHVRDLDGRLWAVLTRGLRKQPSERFASCSELAETLSQWLANLDPRALRRTPSSGASAEGGLSIDQRPTLTAAAAPLDALVRRQKSAP